jgi:predicted RNA-binding Zn ribbon-like protein
VKAIYPVIEPHVFAAKDFVGGDPVLDFINTVTGRDRIPRDWLDGYERFLEWAGHLGLVPDEVLRALARAAQANPAAASAALRRAKELREALFLIITAMISGKAPPKGAVDSLSQYWQAGAAAHELRYNEHEVRLEIRAAAIDLNLIASLIAYRFVEVVLPEPRERLRICAGENCSWLFLDRSKAGRRRWCDMAVCGNSAKSRRFYERMRDGKSAVKNAGKQGLA